MSENVNFYQGSKKNYNPSEMQGGLYFSKDSKEILLNGESYGNAIEVKDWVNELGFARTSDIPEGLEIGETTGTAFDGGRGKAVEDIVNNIKNERIATRITRNDIFGRDVNNLRVEFVVPSTGAESSYDVQFKAATTELAGLMSTADKKKLDSLSDSSDVYVIDYITENSGIITLELYNELRSAIESNKMIAFLDGNDNVFVSLCSLDNNSITMSFSQNIPRTPEERVTVIGSVCVIKSDYTYSISSNSALLIANGDGTKFLGDDGEYHTVDTSEIVADVEGKYDKTGGPITGDVAITGNLTVNGDEVLTNSNYESVIGDVLLTSEADDRYLPLSGGTLTGNLTLPSNGKLTVGSESLSSTASVTIYAQDSISIGAKTTINGRGVTIEKTSGNNPSIIVNLKPAVLTTNSGGITISPITQSAYDELQDKNANTLYIITE